MTHLSLSYCVEVGYVAPPPHMELASVYPGLWVVLPLTSFSACIGQPLGAETVWDPC